MKLLYRAALCALSLFAFVPLAKAQDFPLSPTGQPLMVLYSKTGPELDSVCAHLLASDIEQVTGQKPVVISNVKEAKGRVIVIGNAQSDLVQGIIGKQSSLNARLKNKWECFALKIVDSPVAGISKAFVIAGSDDRGTAYGVFSLSEKIGVSPWNWWADVPVKKQANLVVQQPDMFLRRHQLNFAVFLLMMKTGACAPGRQTRMNPRLKTSVRKLMPKCLNSCCS